MWKQLTGVFLISLIAGGNAMAQKERGERLPPRELEKVHDKAEKPSVRKDDEYRYPAEKVMAARKPAPVTLAPLPMAADEIQRERPEITSETLTADQNVIEEVTRDIEAEFRRRNFTPDDTQAAIISGWILLRTKVLDFVQPLTPQLVVKTVTGLGRLVIKTTPTGARIWIDGQPLKDRYDRDILTEACRWPSSGVHRIKLVLDDQHTVIDEELKIEEGQGLTFERILGPKKP
jgi:hypothetical protein